MDAASFAALKAALLGVCWGIGHTAGLVVVGAVQMNFPWYEMYMKEIQLYLSRAYDLPVTVEYATADGSASAGTDYACSGVAIFPAARGQWHQSNLVFVRYSRLAYVGENLPGEARQP